MAAKKSGPPRNLELEAAIAEDPDDLTGILVYGDWLQGAGDPRGELIALQQAGDDKAAKRLIKKHSDHFIGVAGAHGKQVALDWGLGFFYGATLKFNDHKKMMSALDGLLKHPSSCFLQELVVQMPRVRDVLIDFDAVAEMLLEHGPKTLRRLLVGRPGEWRVPAAIDKAFPRLRLDDAGAWREALDRVRSHRKLKTAINADALPRLEPRDRHAELEGDDLDAGLIAMGLRMELDKKRELRLIESMTQVFTRESLDRFALAMMKQWRSNGELSADRWIYSVVGALGGDLCVQDIGTRLADMNHQRAVTGLGHLAAIGTASAISEINHLAIMPARAASRREAAAQQLAALAKGRGVTVDQLVLENGPRAVAKKDAKRVGLATQRWFFELMVHGQKIDPEDFALHVAHHRLRGPYAAALVWIERRKTPRLFSLTAEGNPVDIKGKSITLGAPVSVAHPVEMGAHVDAWAKRFAKITQPFSQIDRRTYELTAAERQGDTITRFEGRRVGFHEIRDGLVNANWFPYIDHGVEGLGRVFRRGRPMTFVAAIGRGDVDRVWAQAVSHRWMDGKHIALEKVDPVVASEVLLDISRVVGNPSPRRSSPRPAASSPPKSPPRQRANVVTASGPESSDVLPQRGRYPFAELAKSGRSKCVVCGEKIEKATIRIGVERVLETPNFTGKATAWLHADCRDQCPELAPIDDLDARLAANSDGVWT